MKSKHFFATLLSTAAVAGGALLTASPAEAAVGSKGLHGFGGCISKLPLGATILGGTALAAGAGIFLSRRTSNGQNPANDGGSFFNPESSAGNDFSFEDIMDAD